MSDVRAAAERVRRVKAKEKADHVYGGQRQLAWTDLATLAFRYLDDHPADDAEPVTFEFLRDLAGDQPHSFHHGFWVDWHSINDTDSTLNIYKERDGVWAASMEASHDQSIDLGELPTRGAVRRLLAALQIPIKETL